MERDAADRLLAAALTYPGAHEDHPWGDTVVKVDGKIFVFVDLSADETLRLTVKLPDRAAQVLQDHAFTSPTGYGLGKWGWVSCAIPRDLQVDESMLREWIDLSYRSIAKKRRVKELEASTPQRTG
ncbi:MAG: MmcQ/YjbR family DNA-binding protein [Alphaproteobacteria bacterium]|nr:MmcQ/YjbR family DNA-binding protein [Alphaproteobacteria bacterium]